MHCAFASGSIAHVEIYLFLIGLETIGVGYTEINDFFNVDWKSCGDGSHIRAIKKLFAPGREAARSEANSFKAQASEIMALFPLLRHMIATYIAPMGVLAAGCASMLALCDVLHELQELRYGLGSPRALDAALTRHRPLFLDAYGAQFLIPKHHMLQHVPAQVVLDEGQLLDCFPTERKNRDLKRFATSITNTSRFERTVLARAVMDAQRSLHNPHWAKFGVLCGGTVDALQLEFGAKVARRGILNSGLSVRIDDVIVVEERLYLVSGVALLNNGILLIVRRLTATAVSIRAWRCQLSDYDFVEDNGKVSLCKWYCKQSDGALLVVV